MNNFVPTWHIPRQVMHANARKHRLIMYVKSDARITYYDDSHMKSYFISYPNRFRDIFYLRQPF